MRVPVAVEYQASSSSGLYGHMGPGMMYGRSNSGQYVPMGPGMMYNGSKNPAQGQSGNAESSSNGQQSPQSPSAR